MSDIQWEMFTQGPLDGKDLPPEERFAQVLDFSRLPGPVAKKFFWSRGAEGRKHILALMGPVGGGKTWTSLLRAIPLAMEAKIVDEGEGPCRVFKVLVIRDTYPNLAATTLTSWFRIFPKTMPGTVWRETPFREHTIGLVGKDGIPVRLHMQFRAIGDQTIEETIKGWEGTLIIVDEADLHGPDLAKFGLRALRYPAGAPYFGIALTFNAPDVDNWLYEFCVENPSEITEFLRQPGGLSADAENLRNLDDPNYYSDFAAVNSADYVRRMVWNEWGYTRAGAAVWPEFMEQTHVARGPLQAVEGLPLAIGVDNSGRHPAALIGQQMPNGQERFLDEVVAPAEGMGATVFSAWLSDMLRERYPGFRAEIIGSDPAGNNAKFDSDDRTWRDVLAAKTKLFVRVCRTNALTPRLEGVRELLRETLPDGQPRILISPRQGRARTWHDWRQQRGCPALIRALTRGYILRRVSGGDGRYLDEPVKTHPDSDVADALQYYCLGRGGWDDALERGRSSQTRRQPVVAPHGFAVV